MTEVLTRSNISPMTMERLDFIVLAPQHSIEKGTFAEEVRPNSIRSKVNKRVAEYNGQIDEWFTKYFEPAMERIQLLSLSWESAIEWGCEKKPEVKEQF
jgi:hypothetical protein